MNPQPHSIERDTFAIGGILAGAIVLFCGFLAGALIVWGVR